MIHEDEKILFEVESCGFRYRLTERHDRLRLYKLLSPPRLIEEEWFLVWTS